MLLSEPNALCPVRQSFLNLIRGRFPAPALLSGVLHEVAVQLENNGVLEWNILVARVDRVQDVPVPRDLPLRPVCRG